MPASSATFEVPENAFVDCTRSEEHTSELQSHSDLVCRLLLENFLTPPLSTLFPYTTLFRSPVVIRFSERWLAAALLTPVKPENERLGTPQFSGSVAAVPGY